MWYICDVLYAVLYVCVSCFVVRGFAVSRRYIDVCYCDMFSVVNSANLTILSYVRSTVGIYYIIAYYTYMCSMNIMHTDHST